MAGRAAWNDVGRVADRLVGAGYRAQRLTSVGDPAGSLVAAAAERHADLIAIATHGRTGLLRLVLGSVAAETIRLATTPILLVGPGAIAADRRHGAEPEETQATDGERVAGPL